MNIEMSTFYVRLAAIGLILILGFLLGKWKLISTGTNKELTNLLLTVFMPASLFVAFPSEYDESTLNLFFSGLMAGVIVMLMLIVISRVVFNEWWFKGGLRFESQFAFIFNNATFLGYPIVVNTFGPSGVIAYCGFIIAFNIALFSYGIWLFEHKVSLKLLRSIVINPNIIAVILGMIVFLVGIKLPSFITDAVGYVGGATTPLSIICIGFMLSRADFKTILKKWRLVVVALVQLVLGPLTAWGLLTALHFPIEVIQVCTLIQALPTATSLGLFATKYGGNNIESSELVVASTLLSVVTMPVMILIFFG
ncbi:AEC family transporter [Candidatus Saccharibacteria bacterium]|nr:AEC family transporter [Candidatus Saccharibacteria bacterium]MBR3328951.1 AEC family transporter [Candidatus Saccharibacteria bacterium]